MWPRTERKRRGFHLAANVESVGISEHGRVAVGRAQPDADRIARADDLVAQRRVHRTAPVRRCGLCRVVIAQNFLNRAVKQ